jgi:hypothetical protein
VIEERKLAWEKIRFFVTVIGGSVLFFIGLWQFSITARNDFAKPVLEKQLELCIEASSAAAALAQASAPDDHPSLSSFKNLYYGKLAVVEDKCVYRTMVQFKQSVLDKQASSVTPSRAALRIAFACRRMLTRNWSAGLLGVYDPQRLVDSFNDLDDFKETMNAIPECKL